MGPQTARHTGLPDEKLLRAKSDFLRAWDETFHGSAGRTVTTAWSAQQPLLHLWETRRLPPIPSTKNENSLRIRCSQRASGRPALLSAAHICCHDFTFNEKA